MNVCIIGLGLIGGSAALKLKKSGFATSVYGIDENKTHAEQALNLGIVDSITSLDNIQEIDLIILCIPVNAIMNLLPTVLDKIGSKTTVIDFGSTKEGICNIIKNHSKRENFVACHPIAGTENSGPKAAFETLFKNKVNILCEKEKTSQKHIEKAISCVEHLGMRTVFMTAKEHDKHIAYVSHLSHISSFALGKTVLEIEESEKNIFDMAGSGFASTVRLAKSSPDMWAPIFSENAKNISSALGTYISNLTEFKVFIDNNLTENTHKIMSEVNDIRRVLDGIELKETK